MEALWQARLARQVDWVVSDHACCAREMKVAAEHPDDIWLARSGFGGTEYLLSGVFSEGSRRGMAYSHMVAVLAWNPAQRFGLLRKGDVAPGYDTDLALLGSGALRRRARGGAGAGPLRRAPGVAAGRCVVARSGGPGGRPTVHPQLSTGFPPSPTYPHLVDNRLQDRYS